MNKLASLVLGIDVSKDDLVIFDSASSQTIKVVNNETALQKVLSRCQWLTSDYQIGIESTGDYSYLAMKFFLKHGFTVKLINPIVTKKFIKATDQKHQWVYGWKKKLDHPVVNVSWRAAMAFCAWLNQTCAAQLPQGYVFRLPTEVEWEKAARGEFGAEWPWGNDFDPAKCNTYEGKKGGTTPVGAHSPQGDSPYGCANMVGNVWEWTHSLYQPYPYKADDGRENPKSEAARVLRGGSFSDDPGLARCACRDGDDPLSWYLDLGFRVGVVSPISISGL